MLEELSLGFGKTKIKDDECLINFSAKLKQLDCLRKLSIVLYKTDVGDDGIIELCKSL